MFSLLEGSVDVSLNTDLRMNASQAIMCIQGPEGLARVQKMQVRTQQD